MGGHGPVGILRGTKGVQRKGVRTSVNVRVRARKEPGAKHDQTCRCLRPPCLGTPLVPSRGNIETNIPKHVEIESIQPRPILQRGPGFAKTSSNQTGGEERAKTSERAALSASDFAGLTK